MNNKAVIGSHNVKNYADLGGCSVASVNNTLLDRHNSSYHAKAESND